MKLSREEIEDVLEFAEDCNADEGVTQISINAKEVKQVYLMALAAISMAEVLEALIMMAKDYDSSQLKHSIPVEGLTKALKEWGAI